MTQVTQAAIDQAIDESFIRQNRQEFAYRREATLLLVREHWEHFRHEEKERTTLTVFYMAIVVVMLSLIQVPGIDSVFPLFALSALSFVVWGLTWRVAANLREIDARLDELAIFVPLSATQQCRQHLRTPSGHARIFGLWQVRWSTWIPRIFAITGFGLLLLGLWFAVGGRFIRDDEEISGEIKPVGDVDKYSLRGEARDALLIVATGNSCRFNLQ